MTEAPVRYFPVKPLGEEEKVFFNRF